MVVVRSAIVADALEQLRARRIHRHFAGYLSVVRVAAGAGKTKDLRPGFREFFKTFLRVPDAPEDKPYVVPFCEGPASDASTWFNRNVAGSYAPSSLRPGLPFLQVVSVAGRGRAARYALRPKHWKRASTHLCIDEKIPVVPLALFLYRDFAIETSNPSVADIVGVFREEFGYNRGPKKEPTEAFSRLYFGVGEIEEVDDSDWFEPL